MTDVGALLPHAGAMVLLSRVEAWDVEAITCRATSHLDPANPLRRAGRLSACCGLEYAMQAAALHGALRGGGRQPPGYAASLRGVVLHADRLDDPAWGELRVHARLLREEAGGLLYDLRVEAADGTALVAGQAAISLSPRERAGVRGREGAAFAHAEPAPAQARLGAGTPPHPAVKPLRGLTPEGEEA